MWYIVLVLGRHTLYRGEVESPGKLLASVGSQVHFGIVLHVNSFLNHHGNRYFVVPILPHCYPLFIYPSCASQISKHKNVHNIIQLHMRVGGAGNILNDALT